MTGPSRRAATDLDLVRLAQAGDVEAFGELVERNRRAVFRAALARVGRRPRPTTWPRRRSSRRTGSSARFRGEAQFRTWLLSITWRKAIDRRKSMTRWLRLTVTPRDDSGEDAFDIMERMPSTAARRKTRWSSDELHGTSTRLIGTLPKKLRDALLLAGTGEHTLRTDQRDARRSRSAP